MDRRVNDLYKKIRSENIDVSLAIAEIKAIKNAQEKPAGANGKAEVYRYHEPCLRDHQLQGKRILVGATCASLALDEYFRHYTRARGLALEKLIFSRLIEVRENGSVEVLVKPALFEDGMEFEVVFRESGSSEWVTAATGVMRKAELPPANIPVESFKNALERTADVNSLYSANGEIVFGESFRTIVDLYKGEHGGRVISLARVDLTKSLAGDAHRYRFHPLISNSIFLAAIPLLDKHHAAGRYIPFGIKQLRYKKGDPLQQAWIQVTLSRDNGEIILFDACVVTDEGEVVADYKGYSIKRVRQALDIRQESNAPVERVRSYLLHKVRSLRQNSGGLAATDCSRNLMELGFDSLQLVNLTRDIERETGLGLDATVFFEYPSIAELAEFLAKEHAATFNPPEAAQPVQTDNPEHAAPVEESCRDIAIIGMHGRFARASNTGEFWQNIWRETVLFEEIPADHWDYRPWYSPDMDARNKTYSKWGSFIDGVDRFDADFFKMSPREAQWMDPQVRLLLQSVYAAGEDAGVIRQLRGSDTGVFVGICFNDYADKIAELALPLDPYTATGSSAIAANRVSFWFDFKGPSLVLNSACSSSLVALHAACTALRNNECAMAFVGGANLLLSSWHYRYFSTIKALSPTGRCHTFDSAADGYVPGECVASLLLKPLAQARIDGDPIHALIKGSASLHGGHTPSLTAPSVSGEERVIVKAWEDAGINPESLTYIEAHGTGTSLGDPIEINSLKKAFARYTTKQGFCSIGSAKANIGHAEGAAGIAGVIKVIEQLKHKKIPALAHFENLNPHIELQGSPLVIDREARHWDLPAELEGTPRRAGISSFGFSGSYAHIVVEEYHPAQVCAHPRLDSPPGLCVEAVPISAGNPEQLLAVARNLHRHLHLHLQRDQHEAVQNHGRGAQPTLADVAHTLRVGREAMDWRAVFVVSSLAALQMQLQAFIDTGPDHKRLYIDTDLAEMQTPPATAGNETPALDVRDIRAQAERWLMGDNVDWSEIYRDRVEGFGKARKVHLPTYPFAGQRYWLEPPAQGQQTDADTGSASDPETPAPPQAEVSSATPDLPAAVSEPVVAASGRGKYWQAAMKGLSLKERLIRDLKDIASRPLKADSEKLDTKTNFADLGYDSISLTELAGLLRKHFETDITPGLFFAYSTLEKLADYFMGEEAALIGKLYSAGTGLDAGTDNSGKRQGEKFTPFNASEASRPKSSPAVVERPPAGAPPGDEPVAIVGMSGRFPGARDIEQLWEILYNGECVVEEIPANRFDWRAYYGDPRQHPGKTHCIWMGSLPGMEEFDPLFFEISPGEAEHMDPRQRHLLQESWKALEDAGYGARNTARLRVGTFVGIEEGDFQLAVKAQSLTASHNGILASRLAYFLNFTGPTMAINTACSSALVAVHQACLSLRHGDCDLAIAAGVNMIFSPDAFLGMTHAGMLSADGKCFAFDKRANGMVPGEAVAVVVLKRLARARADNDRIDGVIRASGVNYDGKTNGITAPSGLSQTRLLQEVYRRGGIDPADIDYIVTHGTGTQLGDPVEINALNDGFKAVSAPGRLEPGRCALTSTKTNFGHTFAASGLVSLISLLQAFRHQTIPASLHCEQENDFIQWRESPFFVNKTNRDWPATQTRLGAVSAFGMSGTNAHLVVQAPDAAEQAPGFSADYYLLVLSARSDTVLRQKVQALRAALAGSALRDCGLARIGYTLLEGRHHFQHRLAIVAQDVDDAVYSLAQILEGEARSNIFQGRVKRDFSPLAAIEGYMASLTAGLPEQAQPLAQQQSLLALAEFYTQGYDTDWQPMFGNTRLQPVRLPGYPFERGHYWPAAENRSALATAPAGTAHLHPLLHENISTLAKQCFSSRFSGNETFLVDHEINGKKIFPGVAYLELVREAVMRASSESGAGVELTDIVWLRPWIPGEGSRQIFCDLMPEAENGLSFAIYSLTDSSAEPVVYVQGKAVLRERPAAAGAVNLAEIKSACRRGNRSRAEIYGAFKANGIDYGPSFQGVKSIALGESRVIAELVSEAVGQGSERGLWLPPGLLDSALHCTAFLGLSHGDDQPGARVPFALEKFSVYAPLAGELLVTARYSENAGESLQHSRDRGVATVEKFDLDICDAGGAVLVAMRAFTTRALNNSAVSQPAPPDAANRQPPAADKATGNAPGAAFRVPVWVPLRAAEQKNIPAQCDISLCLIGFPESVEQAAKSLQSIHAVYSVAPATTHTPVPVSAAADNYIEIAGELLRLLKALLEGIDERPVYLQVFVAASPSDLRLTALQGMLRSAGIENPRFKGRLVAVAPELDSGLLNTLIAGSVGVETPDVVTVAADGKACLKHWRALPAQPAPAWRWRQAGVFAITGGAGGLGLLVAGHIARHAKGARLFLCGRSPLSDNIAARLAPLEALGASVDYQALDIADKKAAGHWISRIFADQGELTGVIHSAGVIKDSFILNKKNEHLNQVLNPKVNGLEALDQALGNYPVDFFASFSSVAAMGNVGQADYAAANAYMDEFMGYRNRLVDQGERCGHSISINWPLWREGGMQLDAATVKAMEAFMGFLPLPTATGLQCFEQALALPAGSQLMVLYGLPEKLQQFAASAPADAGPEGRTEAEPAPGRPPAVAGLREKIENFVIETIAAVTKVDKAAIDPLEKFEKYGFDSIMAVKATREFEKHLGPQPKTLLFEYVNVSGIADHFLAAYGDKFNELFSAPQNPQTTAAEETRNSDRSRRNGAAAHQSPVRNLLRANRFPARLPSPAGATVHTNVGAGDAAAEPPQKHPIAVIGLGGRYPKANDMDAFWQNLAAGVDCMSDFPARRWDHSKIYFNSRDVLGKTTCLNGSFVEDIDKFDYSYFKVPKVFADHMSPEVRLFLQVAVHTFEDAGYSKEAMLSKYNGDVGVLVGTMTNDYHYFGFEKNLEAGAIASGSGMATIPMMVSYFYGFTGPSQFIDTMCSSSSTCIHTACQMLRHRETEMVLAAGINLIYHPYTTISTSQGNFTSMTSKSVNSYGVGADGTVIGEGIGAVLLKRLDRAVADRDHIYGVIKGSAISNAGERNGFNVPNPNMQTQAIIKAIEEAGVDPQSISYIEGHGSGTRLGDPIEVLGLSNAFGKYTDKKQFCYLGSVKANIGHLLAASGTAGLTKTLLQMKHGKIAPSIHSEQLNDDIDFAGTPFKVPQQLVDWERPTVTVGEQLRALPRRAGITSIAAGGMNSHLIVEEYQSPEGRQGDIENQNLVFVFSAHKQENLLSNLKVFRGWLRGADEPVSGIAYTLQVGKNNLKQRLALRCAGKEQLIDKLKDCIDHGYDQPGVYYHFTDTKAKSDLGALNTEHMADRLINDWLNMKPNVAWENLYRLLPEKVALPGYQFEAVRCWHAGDDYESPMVKPRMFQRKLHPLVERNRSDFQAGVQFDTRVAVDELLDYFCRKDARYRFSLFNFLDAGLAISALLREFEQQPIAVSAFFSRHVSDWSAVDKLNYRVAKLGERELEVAIGYQRKKQEEQHLGMLELVASSPAVMDSSGEKMPELPAQALLHWGKSDAEAALRKLGYDGAPYLQGMESLSLYQGVAVARFRRPAWAHNRYAGNVLFPPCVATALDKALLLVLHTFELETPDVVVHSIEGFRLLRPVDTEFTVSIRNMNPSGGDLLFSVDIFDGAQRLCVHMQNVCLYLGEQPVKAIDPNHVLLKHKVSAAVVPLRPGGESQSEREKVFAYIQETLLETYGFAKSDVGESAFIRDLGLDSIMIVDITKKVNRHFGLKLMPDIFYQNKNIGDLAGELTVENLAV